MKNRCLCRVAQIGLLVLVAGIGCAGSRFDALTFTGTINAYSPQTTTTGPYEVRGPWSLSLNRESGKASFSAAMNMELSDGWVLTFN